MCSKRYNKDLFSERPSRQKPRLVTLADEQQQSEYLIGRCFEHLEAGIPLSRQAVLFRASHHSDALEIELGRRNIPYVKYGGLKFLEAAHVKDVLSILRLAENPKDSSSAFRVLQLLDGVGPQHAEARYNSSGRTANLIYAAGDLSPLRRRRQDSGNGSSRRSSNWPAIRLFRSNSPRCAASTGQSSRGDTINLRCRGRDIEQFEQIAAGFRSRSHLLADLALDPPSATQDLAGPPLREEDFLILSTIHSAKGCEWDVVYVIHAADGNIPSDMSSGTEDQIEEERRLFYVALTRARDFLEVCFPLRYYYKKHPTGDRHSFAQLTRFVPDGIVDRFEKVSLEPEKAADAPVTSGNAAAIRGKIAAMWE